MYPALPTKIVCFLPYHIVIRRFIQTLLSSTEHFHSLWTLPPNDGDFSMRLRLIKTYVTKNYGQELAINRGVSLSRQKRRESNV